MHLNAYFTIVCAFCTHTGELHCKIWSEDFEGWLYLFLHIASESSHQGGPPFKCKLNLISLLSSSGRDFCQTFLSTSPTECLSAWCVWLVEYLPHVMCGMWDPKTSNTNILGVSVAIARQENQDSGDWVTLVTACLLSPCP